MHPQNNGAGTPHGSRPRHSDSTVSMHQVATTRNDLHDLSLERDVLWSFIVHSDLIMQSQVARDDFYSGQHATIFDAIVRSLADDGVVDTERVRGALVDMGRLESVGGFEYLNELTAGIPSRSVPAQRLRKLARQRRLRAALTALAARMGTDEQDRYMAAVDAARAELTALDADERLSYRLLQEAIPEMLKPIGERLSTGFDTLDEATRGGIPFGRVIVLVGAPGAAKTTLATSLADRWERAGCACVFLAADEPPESILVRLGQLAGLSRAALESDGPAGDYVRTAFASSCSGRLLCVLDPEGDDSMSAIEDAERALLHLAGARRRLLVVDSLQSARCRAADAAQSERERIDIKLAVLKRIARRGTLVVAISEMARHGYRSGDRRQNTSAIAAGKESGSIEYGASLLLGLRSVKGDACLVDVEVAKNRLGSGKPEFRLKLDAERASFVEVELPEDDGSDGSRTEELKADRARERVLAAVRANRDLRSANAVSRAAGGTKSDNIAMVKELVEEGSLVKVDGVFRVAVPREVV